jgi:hypothetical protein
MLVAKIKNDLNQALKAGESLKVSTLRMLLAAINNKTIELQKELSDEEVEAVIAKQVKERKESIEAYTAGGREELASKERDEMAILNTYLPQSLSPLELEKIIDSSIEEIGAKTSSDFGKVMGLVMSKIRGRADGNSVAAMVKTKLEEK